MHRPRKPRRSADPLQNAPPVVTWELRLQLAAAFLTAAAVLGIWIFLTIGSEQVVHESRMREKYHLTDAQMVRFTALEKQHRDTYRELRERAERTRGEVATRFAKEKEATPETRRLFEQANVEREACWTEEIEHHRRVSEAIGGERGRAYLAEKERRYQQRKPDRNGFLMLPHK